MGYLREIKKTPRKAKRIDADNLSAMAEKVNRMSVLGDDFASTACVRITGAGKQVFRGPRRAQDAFNRFRIEASVDSTSENAIQVRLGKWTRNATDMSLQTDNDLSQFNDSTDWVTIDGLAASSTYYAYIYIVNETATKEPGIVPQKVYADVIATYLPGELATTTNEYFVLGTFDTNADGVPQDIVQWWLGDIDDIAFLPDNETYYDATDPVIKTTGFNPSDNRHENELEIWNAHSEVDGTGIPVSQFRIPFLEKDANGTGELFWIGCDGDIGGRESGTQKGIQLRNDGTREILQDWHMDDISGDASWEPDTSNDTVFMRDATGPEKRYATRDKFADWIEGALTIDYSQITNFAHTNLNFAGGSPAVNKGNTDHDYDYWVHGETYTNCYGQSIGYDTGRDSSAAAPVIRIDLKDAILDGKDWSVSDNTVASHGAGCLVLTSGGMYAAAGIYANQAGAAAAGYFDDMTTNVTICDGADALAASGNVKITGISGDYYHDSNQGVTVGSMLSGGINYGATNEVQVKDLQPDDYVVVRR